MCNFANIKSKKIVLFVLVWFFTSISYAQTWTATGARSAALSNASANLNDAWAMFNNIGALAFYDKNKLAFAYQNRFGREGINAFSAGLCIKNKYFHNSLTINRLGDEIYSQTGLAYGIAHRIQNASIGLKLHYHQITGQDLGIKSLIILEMGGLMQLTPQLWVGAMMFNLNRAKIASFQDERLPSFMRVALSYQFSEKLLLCVQSEKDLDFPVQVATGLEYWIISKIALRLGIKSYTWQQSYGCGFRLGVFELDYAFIQHPYLSATHQISLQIDWKKFKE